MVVATYSGENKDNSVHDYTDWYEWIAAIKEDFRKFIDYRLVELENSKNLIKELNHVAANLLNKCPSGLKYIEDFKIDIGERYIIIEYPVYDNVLNRYNRGVVIISRNYKNFIFVDSEKSTPSVKVFEVDGIVSEERIIPRIDLDWNEYLISYNLEYLRGRKDSLKELGGFADTPDEVDGSYESFNYCLAGEYASSMVYEDFESLGYMDSSLFDTVAHWLNYDGKIGKKDIDFINNLPSGNFMTRFGRTFADAVCDRRLGELAESLIYNGNKNPRVYFTAIVYSSPVSSILNFIFESVKEKTVYISFVKELLSIIDANYKEIEEDEKAAFIEHIKPYIKKMACAESINNSKAFKDYKWLDGIFGKNKIRSLENN